MSKPDKNKHFVMKDSCPYCGHNFDSASMPGDETIRPVPGDITLCIKCGEVSQFGDEMELSPFNVSQLNLEQLKDIRQKQYLIAVFHCKEANSH
jgi:predicted nucleic-acid-binding Zn-ribbon protein